MEWFVAEIDQGILGCYPNKAQAVASVFHLTTRRIEPGLYEYSARGEVTTTTYYVFTREVGLKHGFDWMLEQWDARTAPATGEFDEMLEKAFSEVAVDGIALLRAEATAQLHGEVEFVTTRQFDSYGRRIEKRNLRRDGRSLSWSAILARANPFIVEFQSDGMFVRKGWREAMKEAKPKEPLNDTR